MIVIENHSRSGVVGDPTTPRITALARRYRQATSYYGVTHSSEPNYLAMIAGRTFGVADDAPSHRIDARNLVTGARPPSARGRRTSHGVSQSRPPARRTPDL
ncbi:MAG: hypothetical protein ACM3QU_11215 [Verrucomicrobiota bacterium]